MLAFLKQYKNPSEKAFLALAIIALCQNTLFIYPVAILGRIGPLSLLSQLVFPLTYIILALVSLKGRAVTSYIRGWDFLLIVFFAIYVALSTTLNESQSQAILEYLRPEILPCIPFFFLGLCIKTDSVSMDAIGKWSCVAVVLSSAYRILYQDPEVEWETNYNMGAAYSLLPNILITISYTFQAKKKIIPIICSIIGIFFLFAMGTRGPIVIAFSLFFVCFMLSGTKQKNWKIFFSILLAVVIVWLATSPALLYLLAGLGDILASMGLSTRAIDFGVSGEFISNTTGRDEITDTLLHQLEQMPFFGYGVMAENRWHILSAHNLYLQSIINYGYVFGTLFLLFLAYIASRALLKSRGKLTQQWLFIWAVYVFVKGFFGGGVLRFEVFILIGSCLRVLRMKEYQIQ